MVSAKLQRSLRTLMPLVDDYWDLPLRDYSAAVYGSSRVSCLDIRQSAFEKLVSFLCGKASGMHCDRADILQLANELEARPVLQTGPHCQLVIAPDAYFTHLFSMIGLMERGSSWYVSYCASTVKYTERAKTGPGWLYVNGQTINVFGLSRSRLDPFSVCGTQGGHSFELLHGMHPARNFLVDRLKEHLPVGEFPSGAAAIKAANQMLWRYCFGRRLKFLQIDDLDVAALTAMHLRDLSSWLSSDLFGGRRMASLFLHMTSELQEDPWGRWLPRTTDFFWLVIGGRLKPLKLRDETFSDPARTYSVHCSPDALAGALEQGEIVPNLLTTFVVIAILPGLRVLGGSRQTIYFPLMRRIFLAMLDQSSLARHRDLAGAIREDEMPGAWGHRTIAPSGPEPWHVLAKSGVAATERLRRQYADMTLGDACGTLPAFANDPLWRDVATRSGILPGW